MSREFIVIVPFNAYPHHPWLINNLLDYFPIFANNFAYNRREVSIQVRTCTLHQHKCTLADAKLRSFTYQPNSWVSGQSPPQTQDSFWPSAQLQHSTVRSKTFKKLQKKYYIIYYKYYKNNYLLWYHPDSNTTLSELRLPISILILAQCQKKEWNQPLRKSWTCHFAHPIRWQSLQGPSWPAGCCSRGSQ